MTYNSMQNNQDFNAMIEAGIKKGKVERSRAFFSLFDRLTGKTRSAKGLSEA